LAVPTTALRKTALNAAHRRLGARMVEFGGWDMPVEYSGIVPEHLAVRTRVGLFDVSHMGEVEVRGPGALALLQSVTCNDVSRLRIGQAQYSALMNERGGMVDDLLVHRTGEQDYFLCVNASRQDADYDWIAGHNKPASADAAVRNASQEYSQLAVQGPRSLAVLQPLASVELAPLKYYWFTRGKVCGTDSLIARTGYTGEDGFEIYFPVSESERIWNAILEAGKSEGIVPCGLGARNTLRLEAGMLLYGHDMDEDVTPLEVNLRWLVKLDKGPFLGSDVLARQAEQGVPRSLAAFELRDRGIARDDAPVLVGDQPVGKVTSGSYAPFLKRSIGFALLPSEHAAVGKRISIDIRGTRAAAEIVPAPIYRRSKN
jgi:aminomethyltransferase